MTSTGGAAAAIDDSFASTWGKRFVDAWTSHDPDRLIALATPDVVREDPFVHPDGVLHGTDCRTSSSSCEARPSPTAVGPLDESRAR